MSTVNNEGRVLKNIESLSGGAQLAIVKVADAFRFGGNWGYIMSTDREFAEKLKLLKSEHPNVKVLRLSNGALVLCNEEFLAYNVNKVVPNALGRPFVEMAKTRKADERKTFAKFLDNLAKGKSKHGQKGNGYNEVKIGIFSVNETNYIRLNAIDYPAYKLSLFEVAEEINKASHSMEQEGRGIFVRSVSESGQEVYDHVARLLGNSKGTSAVYRGLEISETDTGVFLTIRIKG